MSLATERDPTRDPVARAALRLALGAPTARRLLAIFATERGVGVDALTGPNRARPIAHHRQDAYAFIRANRPDLTLAAIARLFGDRHHTTILTGERKALARGYVPEIRTRAGRV